MTSFQSKRCVSHNVGRYVFIFLICFILNKKTQTFHYAHSLTYLKKKIFKVSSITGYCELLGVIFSQSKLKIQFDNFFCY